MEDQYSKIQYHERLVESIESVRSDDQKVVESQWHDTLIISQKDNSSIVSPKNEEYTDKEVK